MLEESDEMDTFIMFFCSCFICFGDRPFRLGMGDDSGLLDGGEETAPSSPSLTYVRAP